MDADHIVLKLKNLNRIGCNSEGGRLYILSLLIYYHLSSSIRIAGRRARLEQQTRIPNGFDGDGDGDGDDGDDGLTAVEAPRMPTHWWSP